MPINVLMFGWELPPHNSGGLGTACLGLTEGLVPLGVDVDFVIPEAFGSFPYDHMNIVSAADYPLSPAIRKKLALTEKEESRISSTLPYNSHMDVDVWGNYAARVSHEDHSVPVAPHKQARWYAHQAATIASKQNFDLVHCHEWMTYYCGIAAKQVAQKRGEDIPFIAHVHATEIDRGGAGGNPAILSIEEAGFKAADRIVAVSHYTKNIIQKHYDVPKNKISVVHNGITTTEEPTKFDLHELKKHYKLVLFMGRMTMQKGPEQFLKLAKAVTDKDPMVKFLMVGSGDMERRSIEMSAHMGLTGKVLFSPFLRGTDVDRAYQMADLFIMPSVSEPFGLVALEAIHNGTPAIVSKQSGVAEVSDSMVKLDFWDTDAMQKAVLHLLHNPDHANQLAAQGKSDLKKLSWTHSAQQLQDVYSDLLSTLTTPSLGTLHA
ncbi:MAG: glycosyltransferase [Patescibacteria group bacterium]|jgi:glycosyltransferase involved in cell wall biosynthesis|nr:glycosyltransferase [Patescibacteria group bacterium]